MDCWLGLLNTGLVLKICSVEGCAKECQKWRRMCGAHCKRVWRYGNPFEPNRVLCWTDERRAKFKASQRAHFAAMNYPTICSVDSCGRKVLALGWCSLHYSRMRRRSSLEKPPMMPEETRRKISLAKMGSIGPWTGKKRGKLPDQWRQRISAANKDRPKTPEHAANILAKQWHGPKPIYKGQQFRSSYEVRLAKAFDARGIKWLYEPTRFNLGTCSYLPDFYLPQLKCYWEGKGYFSDEAKNKVTLFRRLHPDKPLIVATKQVIKLMEVSNGRSMEAQVKGFVVQQCAASNGVNSGDPKPRGTAIPSQAKQECFEGVETRASRPERLKTPRARRIPQGMKI